MAALAPGNRPDDVLPALARNIVTNGYQAAGSNDVLEQTEYLKLVIRYLSQARELEKLADSSGAIKIETCDSTQTGELLRVLGYRMRGGCGSEVVLETLNATRAFLTIDSGFPLAELEQDLRTNRLFAYDFKPTQIPILYTQDYWLSSKDRQGAEFIDSFLGDPSLCRLYLALSKLDPSRIRRTAQGHHGSKNTRLCARSGFLRRHVPGSKRPSGGAGRRALGKGLGRAGGSFARQAGSVLRAPDHPGRRLAGQLLRRAFSNQQQSRERRRFRII